MTVVGIIGGTGKFGSWFKRFFQSKGFKVLTAGRKTRLSYRQLIEKSNAVIYCVPILETAKIIRQTARFAKPGSCITDFTSVKEKPLKAMLKFAPKGVEVFGMHPIFGPGVKSLKGQNIAFCMGKGKKWLAFFKKLFRNSGANVFECFPKKHDEAMALVQVLSQLSVISFQKTLQEAKIKNLKNYSSPIFEKLLEIVSRIKGQSPELYPNILLGNENSEKIAKAFAKNARHFEKLIEKKDFEGLRKFYEVLGKNNRRN